MQLIHNIEAVHKKILNGMLIKQCILPFYSKLSMKDIIIPFFLCREIYVYTTDILYTKSINLLIRLMLCSQNQFHATHNSYQ